MRKIDIAVAVFFIAVVAAFIISSASGAVRQKAEPVSKAEIETRLMRSAPAPKAVVMTASFTVLTQAVTEDAQTAFEAEPEEVITEPENTPETAESIPEMEEPVSEPDSIPGEDATFTEEEPQAEQSLTYLGEFRITHYCPNECCCGSWAGGPTASGTMPTAGWTIACGEDIPFGTILLINGHEYCCEDRGVPSGCVDIFVDSHEEAEALGLYYTDVYLVG